MQFSFFDSAGIKILNPYLFAGIKFTLNNLIAATDFFVSIGAKQFWITDKNFYYLKYDGVINFINGLPEKVAELRISGTPSLNVSQHLEEVISLLSRISNYIKTKITIIPNFLDQHDKIISEIKRSYPHSSKERQEKILTFLRFTGATEAVKELRSLYSTNLVSHWKVNKPVTTDEETQGDEFKIGKQEGP